MAFTWCSSSLVAAIALARPDESIGRVKALEGSATVLHQGSTQTEPFQSHSQVYQAEFIRTQVASRVKLVLVDGTLLTRREQGTLNIPDYVCAPQRQRQRAFLLVTQGIFRILARQVLWRSMFAVHTSNAVAASRGTDWRGQVQADATALVVLAGAVAVLHARPEIAGQAIKLP